MIIVIGPTDHGQWYPLPEVLALHSMFHEQENGPLVDMHPIF